MEIATRRPGWFTVYRRMAAHSDIRLKQQLKCLILHEACRTNNHRKYQLVKQRKKSINATETLTEQVNKHLEAISRWPLAWRSLGYSVHSRKKKNLNPQQIGLLPMYGRALPH